MSGKPSNSRELNVVQNKLCGEEEQFRLSVRVLVSVKCVLKCSLFPRNLAAIQDREICCYSISCKEKDNIGNY